MQKVYVFRMSFRGMTPELHKSKVIHEVEGTVTPKFVRFDGENYRGELLNYKRQLRIGDNVFLTLAEAKTAARERLKKRMQGLEEELADCSVALEQVS